MSSQSSTIQSSSFTSQVFSNPSAFSPFIDRRPSIVIAEDSKLLQEVLTLGLTAEGYFVRCADDGESCWQSLLSSPFDLLITDMEMPKLGGMDLLRRMRTASITQPVILMSGNLPPKSPELDQLLSPGATVAKPLSFSDFIPLIEMLLGTWNVQARQAQGE